MKKFLRRSDARTDLIIEIQGYGKGSMALIG
jgi:hypothetical protein